MYRLNVTNHHQDLRKNPFELIREDRDGLRTRKS